MITYHLQIFRCTSPIFRTSNDLIACWSVKLGLRKAALILSFPRWSSDIPSVCDVITYSMLFVQAVMSPSLFVIPSRVHPNPPRGNRSKASQQSPSFLRRHQPRLPFVCLSIAVDVPNKRQSPCPCFVQELCSVVMRLPAIRL